MFVICDFCNLVPLQIRTCFVSTRTCSGEIFERSEDMFDVWSLLRFLVPALLGDLPDRWGHSWDFKRSRFRRAFPLRDHEEDPVDLEFRKGHLSGRELKTKER